MRGQISRAIALGIPWPMNWLKWTRLSLHGSSATIAFGADGYKKAGGGRALVRVVKGCMILGTAIQL